MNGVGIPDDVISFGLVFIFFRHQGGGNELQIQLREPEDGWPSFRLSAAAGPRHVGRYSSFHGPAVELRLLPPASAPAASTLAQNIRC